MAYIRNNWNVYSSSVFIIFFLKTGMACQMDEATFEIQTTVRIPCIHDVPPAVIDFVKWTKSVNDDCYQNGVESLVSLSSDGNRNIQDPNDNYDIDTDFSLLIRNVTARFIGIYRCTVVPKDATPFSEIDTRLTVFKYPDEPPSITYEIRGIDEINITCTQGPVFPLRYPSFSVSYHNNHTIRNADGTYNVSISAVQQFNGSEINFHCSHSYDGQHHSSFLQVRRSYYEQGNPCTTDPPQGKTARMSNIFPTSVTVPMPEQFTCGSTLDIRVITILILILILIVMVIVIILVVLIHRRNKKKRVGTFQDMPLMKTSTESGIGYVITDGENFRILLKVLCKPTLQNNLTAPMMNMVDIGDLSANIDLEADENMMKSYVRVHAERDVLQKY